MIKSSPFGPTTLTDEDADRFLRHMRDDPVNPLAANSLRRGRNVLEAMNSSKFTEVNVFDGSIGRDGQYVWKQLPSPMTRKQAENYASKLGWCPIERFR